MKLIFLQLPRLDPDVDSPGENTMSAAACLGASLAASDEATYWTVSPTPKNQDEASDAALIDSIAEAAPDVISATCYLWNIERTIALLRKLKRRIPGLRAVLGGPDIALDHPLLTDTPTRRAVWDVLVIGEGEPVFPDILLHFRTGHTPDYRGVAWRTVKGGRREGKQPRPLRPLIELLPSADDATNRPDAAGMAYLETSRGCPLHCAFCCYNLRRTTLSCLPPDDVSRRIRILRERGAREIRLVDPTFNAHPHFDAVIEAIARENWDRAIAFFVEIRADTLTDEQAARLAEAGVVEAEVGIQSTDSHVLAIVHRPLREELVLRGIEALLRHGIRPTLDFMYGLPGQGADDARRSLNWLARFGGRIHPQFLPTLLLPGTELRDRANELGLKAQRPPPYRVTATDKLSTRQLAEIEEWAAETLGGFDSPTRRFAGTRLPDLFPSRTVLRIEAGVQPPFVQAWSNRQALILAGPDLFSQRNALTSIIRRCVCNEPHILWQFVLAPEVEEPLDLLDLLIEELRRLPGHWLDRLVSRPGSRQLAARRLFVKVPRGVRWSSGWKDGAETLLAEYFH